MNLFGTDGIRGRCGQFPLDNTTLQKIGFALSKHTKNTVKNIYLAHDGRESSESIIDNLLKGLLYERDFKIIYLGLFPTPAIPTILSTIDNKDSVGIQITASHNPYSDNGIKIFNELGYKLSSHDEKEINNLVEKCNNFDSANKIKLVVDTKSRNNYINHLLKFYKKNKTYNKNLRIAVDCSNGALSEVISELNLGEGINLEIFNFTPNGKNINQKCGSTYPTFLKNIITNKNRENIDSSDFIDFGISFDGDGDRSIVISDSGKILDGDEQLLLLATQGTKKIKKVVGTKMTNFGIRREFMDSEIKFIETDVGDKYVLTEIIKNDYEIGSESSGHIIHTDSASIPIGDALITLIKFIHLCQSSDKSIDDLYPSNKKYPSKLINIETNNSEKFISDNEQIFIKLRELFLDHGRILIRKSGTQSMVRILLEHKNNEVILQAESLLDKILK